MKMFSDSKIEGQSRQCEVVAPQLVHVVIECRHKSKTLWSKSPDSSTDEQQQNLKRIDSRIQNYFFLSTKDA